MKIASADFDAARLDGKRSSKNRYWKRSERRPEA